MATNWIQWATKKKRKEKGRHEKERGVPWGLPRAMWWWGGGYGCYQNTSYTYIKLSTNKLFLFIFCVWMFCLNVRQLHHESSWCPWRPEESIRCRCWESNSEPLEEHPMLLTTEPWHQLQFKHLFMCLLHSLNFCWWNISSCLFILSLCWFPDIKFWVFFMYPRQSSLVR